MKNRFAPALIFGIAILGAMGYRYTHPLYTPSQQEQMRVQASLAALEERFASTHSLVPVASASSISAAPSPEPANTEPEVLPEHRTVLVDQDFSAAKGKSGMDWITAIGAKKISGDSKFGRLEVTISRNGLMKSFQSVVLYVGPTKANGAINTSLEWKRGRYLDAKLAKGCGRAINPKGSFSTLGVEKASKYFDLSAVPTTKADTCEPGQDVHDFLNAIRTTPLVIGFYPTDYAAHIKVVLIHDGGLKVTSPFTR